MKQIKVKNKYGIFQIFVDDLSYDVLKNYKIHVKKCGAKHYAYFKNGNKNVYLHREIMK